MTLIEKPTLLTVSDNGTEKFSEKKKRGKAVILHKTAGSCPIFF